MDSSVVTLTEVDVGPLRDTRFAVLVNTSVKEVGVKTPLLNQLSPELLLITILYFVVPSWSIYQSHLMNFSLVAIFYIAEVNIHIFIFLQEQQIKTQSAFTVLVEHSQMVHHRLARITQSK